MAYPPVRVSREDIEAFKALVDGASDEEQAAQREGDRQRADQEHAAFEGAYLAGRCYICGYPLATTDRDDPCVHWLLRRCKFKKKDFPLVCARFDFSRVSAYARWCANMERPLANINDLDERRAARKVFEFTVRWKNIEWTFDCSENDYIGHGGAHSNFPHYHMQMRIDGRPFIDFGDFHIPFSQQDVFRIDLSREAPDHFEASYGAGGAGMQTVSEMDAEKIVELAEVAGDDESATFRMRTFINTGDGGIDGAALRAMFEESERTGETLASLARKRLGPDHSVRTIIAPADSMPEIAKRSERQRR